MRTLEDVKAAFSATNFHVEEQDEVKVWAQGGCEAPFSGSQLSYSRGGYCQQFLYSKKLAEIH